jgi:fructosamine-3-kinase
MNRLRTALAQAMDCSITAMKPCPGGDINQAFQVQLADGRWVFVKYHSAAPADMFATEVRGLAFLAEPQVVRVPKVLHVTENFLVLEWIHSRENAPDFDERLGHGLASLHRAHPSIFGLEVDNYIGRLPQANQAMPTWAEFYRERRLLPQTRLAIEKGRMPERMRQRLDQVLERLPERVGPSEPPARLHGDLWGGNILTDETGSPCLIDPAVYGGHREMDLAMMRLFGGFSPRVFAAYAEAYPLSVGHQERVPLYQLYFLLVHLNLFGGAYLDSVARTLAQVV